jgi:PAS domain S-box-containing protein
MEDGRADEGETENPEARDQEGPTILRPRPIHRVMPDDQDLSSVPPEQVPHLVHQLHVQQVQLEMQNEELRQSQALLAEACDHYTQLFDFSPAGYVTLTPEGRIAEANLRFCAMVGTHRSLVVNRLFRDFLAPQDWELWTKHVGDVLTVKTTQLCKVLLLPKTGLPLVLHVESLARTDPPARSVTIQIAMLDVTLRERAEQAVRENERKVQQTAAKLLTAQDEERRRISRDLHDDHCQRLAAMIIDLDLLLKRHPGGWTDPAEHLKPMKLALKTLLADLRGLSHDLHPGQTTSVAFFDALRTYLADFTERTQIPTTLHAAPTLMKFPPIINTALYRIVQEGLMNIHKHAKATRISITVQVLPDAAELVIKDDGRGFDPEIVLGTHHLGLTSMRERAEQLNGTLTIRSRPEWGTMLLVRIPLPDTSVTLL